MEKERLALLEADMHGQEVLIDAVYVKLDQRKKRYAKDQVALESLSYQLHNLYSAFEDLFRIVAMHFENRIADEARWHKEMLNRMRTSIEGIRPPLISDKAYELLNELHDFRLVFRHAYGYELEPEKIKIVLRKALVLRKIYKKEIAKFLEAMK